jgi:hypothetical protein
MGLQVQRLPVRREQASEQRVTLGPPLAPKVQALWGMQALLSW